MKEFKKFSRETYKIIKESWKCEKCKEEIKSHNRLCKEHSNKIVEINKKYGFHRVLP